MQKTGTQREWIERAREALPAGTFGNFSADTVIREGKGARVWDMDGNEYVDYLISSGPMVLGHSHPEVLEAIFEQLPKGQTFFANSPPGIELAEEIAAAVPCARQVRFVSSGGEATMYAARLARAHAGRDKILKFEGGFHGMSAEAQMSVEPERRANSPEAIPDSAGIPRETAAQVLVAPFNDIESVRSLLDEHGGEIAGVIVEPLQRIIPPKEGFLQALREETEKRGILLIFDEIVTGFRMAWGGAQERHGVIPDIAALGKIIGGGFPLAAIAGPSEIMAHFDKEAVGKDKWLMQRGTLSGNPVAAAAGLKTLEILKRDGNLGRLRRLGEEVMAVLREALDPIGVPYHIAGDPTVFDVVFSSKFPRDYWDTRGADAQKAAAWNRGLREGGIFKSPGKTYPCLALGDRELERTRQAALAAARAL